MSAKKTRPSKPPVNKAGEKKAPVTAVKKTGAKKNVSKTAKKQQAYRPLETLKNAKTILLVDWPDKSVPLALLKAGFMVIGYSPDKYTLLSYQTNYAEDRLVFTDLEGLPGQVEIVNIFRPEEEHEEIINRHALPLKAKCVWLHPPVTSARTAKIAKKQNLNFVEGHDIARTAADLSGKQ